MTSAQSSAKQSKTLPKWLIISFIAISFIGFLDTSYLTVNHYTGGAIECNILKGCEKVTGSEYATIFGVPMALLGLLFYLFMLIGSLLYLDTKSRLIPKIFLPVTAIAFLFSWYLVYLQLGVIKAVCQYCMLSALTSTLLFVCSLLGLKYLKS